MEEKQEPRRSSAIGIRNDGRIVYGIANAR